MPLLFRVIPIAFVIVTVLSLQATEPSPHPNFPNRLVQERSGLRVEYHPGQEDLVEVVFEEVEKWNRYLKELIRKTKIDRSKEIPLSHYSMKLNRDEILNDIAHAIGLSRPSDFQKRVFDVFLRKYEVIDISLQKTFELAKPRRIMIWQRERLIEHLRDGTQVPGFSYDEATDSGDFSMNLDFNFDADPRIQAINEEIESLGINHDFNYRIHNHSVNIGASVTTAPKTKSEQFDRRTENLELIFPLPIVLSDKTADLPPREIVQQQLIRGDLYGIVRNIVRPYPVKPMLAFTVLHETIETGLIDTQINSPDRRWLCDGTANYLSWEIAQKRAGREVADQAYNLESQLKRHKSLQSKIDLRNWPASENIDLDSFGEELNAAHYTYATRAVFIMADRLGEQSIADLWKEIGKTPKRKTNMKAVAKAFKNLTGENLSETIKLAENDPIP